MAKLVGMKRLLELTKQKKKAEALGIDGDDPRGDGDQAAGGGGAVAAVAGRQCRMMIVVVVRLVVVRPGGGP